MIQDKSDLEIFYFCWPIDAASQVGVMSGWAEMRLISG